MGWMEPQGEIVAFPFLKEQSIISQAFAQRLVETAEIWLLLGKAFERGYFRVGFGVRPETLRQAMELISEFIISG